MGVQYTCAGVNGVGRRCSKLLFVFSPPGEKKVVDLGRVEVKCRRCHTVNIVSLADVV